MDGHVTLDVRRVVTPSHAAWGDPNGTEVLTLHEPPWRVREGCAAPLAGCAARPPWWVVQAHGVLDAKARLFPNLGVTRTPAVEGDGRG